MNPTHIRLIQESWLRVAPSAVTAFYDNLFALRPALRAMFPEDISGQRKKLHQMLAVVVRGLRKPEALIPAVQDLGRRHVGYGVNAGHYEVVGKALLQTLAEGLGEAWTSEVEFAWTSAYTLLSQTMIAAADAHVQRQRQRPRRLSTNGDLV